MRGPPPNSRLDGCASGASSANRRRRPDRPACQPCASSSVHWAAFRALLCAQLGDSRGDPNWPNRQIARPRNNVGNGWVGADTVQISGSSPMVNGAIAPLENPQRTYREIYDEKVGTHLLPTVRF